MPPDDGPTYVIDSNCLDHIKRRPDANLAWDTIIRLIEEGRLKIVEQAMNEIQNVDPEAYERLRPYRRALMERITPDLLAEAGRISDRYRRMSRPYHQNDTADPWLVAAGTTKGYTVVTDERKRRQRIPVVCEREGVPCINLDELLEAEMPE